MLILSRPLHGESLVYYLALIHASLANHEIKVSLLFFFPFIQFAPIETQIRDLSILKINRVSMN